MDALRTWVKFGGIDGFRFDLATVLGRRDDGFDASAPLITAISQDPVLREVRLIAEPWDIGPGGYQVGAFPESWREWNDQFRDTMRKFWRGDNAMVPGAVTRFAGSSDIFGPYRRPSSSVNFIVAHDGFTLADLVSYERKHNEANGENNRDGTHDEFFLEQRHRRRHQRSCHTGGKAARSAQSAGVSVARAWHAHAGDGLRMRPIAGRQQQRLCPG